MENTKHPTAAVWLAIAVLITGMVHGESAVATGDLG